MSTIYRVKTGQTEVCSSCGAEHEGGEQMIRLTSLTGERLGNCCFTCYDQHEEEMDERWG